MPQDPEKHERRFLEWAWGTPNRDRWRAQWGPMRPRTQLPQEPAGTSEGPKETAGPAVDNPEDIDPETGGSVSPQAGGKADLDIQEGVRGGYLYF